MNSVNHPWRRFLARLFDLYLYGTLWSIFIMLVFNVNLMNIGNLGKLTNSFIVFLIMLLIEPLWLRLTGTTPGKAIFGLGIKDKEGRLLSYSRGFERTWEVIGKGMGYNIPIYCYVRLWKSYRKCSQNEILPWDEGISYTIKDTRAYRGFVYISACVITGLILTIAMSAQILPPNRGELTVEEFAENFNYYADYLDIDFGNKYLDKSGQWAEKASGGTYIADLGTNAFPEYRYITENGHVTGLYFEVEYKDTDHWIYPNRNQMILASLSIACAQEEMRLFSGIPDSIVKYIEYYCLEDFDLNIAGIEISNDISYEGFTEAGSILVPEGLTVHRNHFRQQFSIKKIN